MGFWPMKCALGWDFYQRLWAAMSLPLLLIFIVLLYTLVRGRVKGEAQWLDTSFPTGCSVMIVYLMFPSSTKSLLEGNRKHCPPLPTLNHESTTAALRLLHRGSFWLCAEVRIRTHPYAHTQVTSCPPILPLPNSVRLPPHDRN